MQSKNIENTNQIQSVKFTYKNEIRRFQVNPEDLTYEKLESQIKSLIKVDDATLVIKYHDDESEWITMDKDLELECALHISQNALLRISVSLADDSEEPHWKKFKGRRGGWKNKKCDAGTDDNPDCEQKFKGGRRGQKFQKKWKKDHDETEVTESESEMSPKWKGRGGKGRGKGRRGWKRDEESEATSEISVDTTLTLEEIKAQISNLVESKKVLSSSFSELNANLRALQADIKECRQQSDSAEKITHLRTEIGELKQKKFAVKDSLQKTRTKIQQLRQLAKTKN
jgi:hypothetical protein